MAARWIACVIRYASPFRFQRPASAYSSAISPRMSKISFVPAKARTSSAAAAGTWLRACTADSRWRRTRRVATAVPTSTSKIVARSDGRL